MTNSPTVAISYFLLSMEQLNYGQGFPSCRPKTTPQTRPIIADQTNVRPDVNLGTHMTRHSLAKKWLFYGMSILFHVYYDLAYTRQCKGYTDNYNNKLKSTSQSHAAQLARLE